MTPPLQGRDPNQDGYRNLAPGRPLGTHFCGIIRHVRGRITIDIEDFRASAWAAGGLYHAGLDGRSEQLLDLAQGSADIGILPAQKIVLVPMMMDNVLVAYQVE